MKGKFFDIDFNEYWQKGNKYVITFWTSAYFEN